MVTALDMYASPKCQTFVLAICAPIIVMFMVLLVVCDCASFAAVSCLTSMLLIARGPCVDLSGNGEVDRGPRREARGCYRHPGGMRCIGLL